MDHWTLRISSYYLFPLGGLVFFSDCLCDFQTYYHRLNHKVTVIFSDGFIILYIETSKISLQAKKKVSDRV